MFWKKKEISYKEEQQISLKNLEGWIDFVAEQIAYCAVHNYKEVDDLEMPIEEAVALLESMKSTYAFIKELEEYA